MFKEIFFHNEINEVIMLKLHNKTTNLCDIYATIIKKINKTQEKIALYYFFIIKMLHSYEY